MEIKGRFTRDIKIVWEKVEEILFYEYLMNGKKRKVAVVKDTLHSFVHDLPCNVPADKLNDFLDMRMQDTYNDEQESLANSDRFGEILVVQSTDNHEQEMVVYRSGMYKKYITNKCHDPLYLLECGHIDQLGLKMFKVNVEERIMHTIPLLAEDEEATDELAYEIMMNQPTEYIEDGEIISIDPEEVYAEYELVEE